MALASFGQILAIRNHANRFRQCVPHGRRVRRGSFSAFARVNLSFTRHWRLGTTSARLCAVIVYVPPPSLQYVSDSSICSAMAPLKDETIDALRDTIHKLESRVQQLEAKLGSSGGESSSREPRSNAESVRIILMGPPGAGRVAVKNLWWGNMLIDLLGKGTQAPRIKEKYCACHLVC